MVESKRQTEITKRTKLDVNTSMTTESMKQHSPVCFLKFSLQDPRERWDSPTECEGMRKEMTKGGGGNLVCHTFKYCLICVYVCSVCVFCDMRAQTVSGCVRVSMCDNLDKHEK